MSGYTYTLGMTVRFTFKLTTLYQSSLRVLRGPQVVSSSNVSSYKYRHELSHSPYTVL